MDEKKTIDITSFTKAMDGMVAKNESSYNLSSYGRRLLRGRIGARTYTREEIDKIIDSGSLEAQIALSRHYFAKGGFYQRLLLHYATILKYTGILIPSPSFGKSLSEKYIYKKYYNAISFIDKARLPQLFTHIAIKALRDGCYYGVIQEVTDSSISILDLPIAYCRSRFKDKQGNDIIEFNVTYFDTITDEEYRKSALDVYPREVVSWYNQFKAGKVKKCWCYMPSDIGICMPMLDDAPIFLNIIPAALEYEEAKALDRERNLEEIRKILVQKIPHMQDGGFLLEPEEAEELHIGAVDMMKNNKNLSVLTTYADVDAIVSKTANDNSINSIDKSLQNIYAESGSSSQLFGTESNLSLATSVNNDMALMMTFAQKLDNFITSVVNKRFGNANISFNYKILPITHYNKDEYIDNGLKMANSGYSYLIPALAMDISQKELSDLKDLENDVLNLKEKLIPLSTAFTETGNVGRPEKPAQEKSAKTVANEESLDNGGSN